MDQNKVLHVHKATNLGLENVQISIDLEISPNLRTLTETNALFREDGKLIFDTLLKTLPGGTLDVLLCFLLENKKSGLICAY